MFLLEHTLAFLDRVFKSKECSIDQSSFFNRSLFICTRSPEHCYLVKEFCNKHHYHRQFLRPSVKELKQMKKSLSFRDAQLW